MNRRLGVGGIFLVLSGCMVGPNYERPETNMPAAFVEAEETLSSSDEEFHEWWRHFEDPLLDELISEVVRSNFDLLIALERIEELRAVYRIDRSYLWPEIDLNATATRSLFSQNIFTSATTAVDVTSDRPASQSRGAAFGPPIQNFFQIGFDAIWELDLWGKFRRQKKAALSQVEASQFAAHDVLITAVSELIREYTALRALQEELQIATQKVAADSREVALMADLLKSGLKSDIDLSALEAEAHQDAATIPPLQSGIKNTIYRIAVLIGAQPENLEEKFHASAPIPLAVDKIPSGLPSDLLRRRPDIRAAERTLQAASEKIGVAVSAFFPSLALTGDSYGYEGNQLNNWFKPASQYWTIGPLINWNLIDFGRTRALIDQATSVQKQALLSYEKTVISALQDVEGSLVAYFEEQKRLRSLTEELAKKERVEQLTRDQFHAGLVNEQSTLEALKSSLDAKQAVAESKRALSSDLVAVYKALGGSWVCSSMP
jgi:multidrug efflux system outer membrane protein